jgi:hypothetical protein
MPNSVHKQFHYNKLDLSTVMIALACRRKKRNNQSSPLLWLSSQPQRINSYLTHQKVMNCKAISKTGPGGL